MRTTIAEAHCDIPCGIYDPTPAKIAAKTVARMVDQLLELTAPDDDADDHVWLVYKHNLMRRVMTKEQHAEICKHELEILWSDFFKPEHLKQFPDLQTQFWQAVKLCSTNKQELSREAAADLIQAVDQIAQIFYQTKKAPERFDAYKLITDNLY